jgi:GTPase SAR1 family protein
VFVYDVSDRHSFERLQFWFEDAERCVHLTEGAVNFIIGNKMDLNRVVSLHEGRVCAMMSSSF